MNRTIYQVPSDVLNRKNSMIEAKKALVVLAIEKALLEVGKPTYNQVLSKLNKEYHCYLSDCYENPEYLSRVLKELYGQSHLSIIKSIKEYLAEMSMQEGIENFVMKISE